jgi:DNA-binding MarR family transcriptional regulator
MMLVMEAVTDDVGYALLSLGRAYQMNVSAALADFPHGQRGFQTLATVIRGEQPSQLALAGCLGIDRTVMVYLLDDLVAAGLVERQPNPSDRRQRKVVPTGHGLRVHADLAERVRAAGDKLMNALEPDERETFRRLLTRAASGVDGSAPCSEADAPSC